MKKVLTYGTFDLLHTGHINLLRRAKEYGDYLIVAISSDEFNALKGKKAYYSFEQRKAILEAIRYVDEVIAEDTWEQKTDDVKKYDVDVFVMGDDWEGDFDFLKDHCEVVYLPRTVGISTTKIKEDLNSNDNGQGVRYISLFTRISGCVRFLQIISSKGKDNFCRFFWG